jgi:hypothetical protein
VVCVTERQWWRHYGEMVLAMLAAMAAVLIIRSPSHLHRASV